MDKNKEEEGGGCPRWKKRWTMKRLNIVLGVPSKKKKLTYIGKVPNQGWEGSTETKLQKTFEVWKFWEGKGGPWIKSKHKFQMQRLFIVKFRGIFCWIGLFRSIICSKPMKYLDIKLIQLSTILFCHKLRPKIFPNCCWGWGGH